MTWVQTYTGKAFDVQNPSTDDIDPMDIAHSLSMLCRFNGHCRQFYSVAEHSVRVAEILPGGLKLHGLLHDAAEAYIGDIASPIKPMFGGFKDTEDRIMRMVCRRFRIEYPMHDEVKHADMVLLSTEKRDLMGNEPRDWVSLPKPLKNRINPWSHYFAQVRFLQLLLMLQKG